MGWMGSCCASILAAAREGRVMRSIAMGYGDCRGRELVCSKGRSGCSCLQRERG